MEDSQKPRIGLDRLIGPRSVAVVGASEDVDKFGGRVIHYLMKHGYAGRLIPINPNRATIRGLPAYPAVSAAPEAPDVAILAVPAAQLETQVADCAAAGVGGCIVITGKLAEAGPEGAALEEKIVATARSAGMRILGPNCLGILNPVERAMLSSSLALDGGPFGAGGIGMVSQSGALMGTLFAFGSDHGARFSRCVSVGNQADVELVEVLEHLVADEATRSICLYVEGVKHPRRFHQALRDARAADKPVFIVKVGRSEAGVRAARSHTASLAGSYAAFEAICRDAGAVLMEDTGAMVLAADAAIRLPRLPRAGMGVAPIASSGGSTAVFADLMPGAGLRLAELSAETRAVLGGFMPESHVALPLDTGSFHSGQNEAAMETCIRAFMADPDVGAVAFPMTTQPFMAQRAAVLPALCREGRKPLIYVMSAGSIGDAARERLREADFPYYDRVSDALAVLRALEAEAAGRARRMRPDVVRPSFAPPPQPSPASQERESSLPCKRSAAGEGWGGGPNHLTEHETKSLLSTYGIPVTRERLAHTIADALAAARDIGFPVVLKGVSRAVVHKSDLGLVRLDIRDEAALRDAYRAIEAAVDRHAPGTLDGVLVQEMARGEVEAFLGATHDAGFGPMVLAGIGGVLVEALHDVRMAPAPITADDARALFKSLKLAPLLHGLRGRPPADLDAAVEALVRLSWLAADLGPRLVELDVNPLILRRVGEGAIAVDARATLA